MHWFAILLFCMVVAAAPAQTAFLTLSHDRPGGIVLPGEPVRLRATLTWTGNPWQFNRIAGDVVASPNVGAAQTGVLTVGLSPLNSPGTPSGGSLLAVEINSGGGPFFTPSPLWSNSPLEIVRFDWTAPQTPGVVNFSWSPRPDLPNALFFQTGTSVLPTPYPTTYLGTSITVIPAPASATALALAGLAVNPGRRRR